MTSYSSVFQSISSKAAAGSVSRPSASQAVSPAAAGASAADRVLPPMPRQAAQNRQSMSRLRIKAMVFFMAGASVFSFDAHEDETAAASVTIRG